MAISQAVNEVTGLNTRIKWPNDVILNGRKLCGILLEMVCDPDTIESVIVGVGLNVKNGSYPPDLREKAISLSEVTEPPLRRVIFVHYLEALEKILLSLEAHGFDGIAQDYLSRSCTIGSKVQVSGSVNMTGTAEGIDNTGALLVRGEDGVLKRILSGDVSVRGLMGYV